STVLPDAIVAGQAARHIRCGDELAGFWELWVDRETGVVLKVKGTLGNDDFHPFATTSEGGFIVTSIDYSPSFAPGTFRAAPPPGAKNLTPNVSSVPPFEATFS